MRLVDINPYVRFARIFKKEINRHYIVGLDHRAFYCADGKGIIIGGEQKYEMQKGSLILFRAGTPYKGCSHTDKMELYAVNFDMVHSPSCPREPISYIMLPHFREEKELTLLALSSAPETYRFIPDGPLKTDTDVGIAAVTASVDVLADPAFREAFSDNADVMLPAIKADVRSMR